MRECEANAGRARLVLLYGSAYRLDAAPYFCRQTVSLLLHETTVDEIHDDDDESSHEN